MKEFDRIIFVGRGGNCREVMAAEILKSKPLYYHPEILARGEVVLFPEPLNQKAEAVLISRGFQLKDFMSVQLTEEDITDNTLILTFQKTMMEKLKKRFPSAENIYVLTEVSGDELEIFDPCGQEITTYGLCYEALDKSVQKLADVLNDGDFFVQQEKIKQETVNSQEGEK